MRDAGLKVLLASGFGRTPKTLIFPGLATLDARPQLLQLLCLCRLNAHRKTTGSSDERRA